MIIIIKYESSIFAIPLKNTPRKGTSKDESRERYTTIITRGISGRIRRLLSGAINENDPKLLINIGSTKIWADIVSQKVFFKLLWILMKSSLVSSRGERKNNPAVAINES
ncbi:MAG: hypothetical protein Q7R94_00290 [bacterium]|nr:hypothetical protein [bacterium]